MPRELANRILLYSAELARLAGVSTDTLRYNERRGLLPAALGSPSGYRLFPQALARVQLIRSALCFDFSVTDLASILYERERSGALRRRVRELAAEKRGDKGMGFSQSATTHHFLLNSTGGEIQVLANDPADAAIRDSVRMHLAHITPAFQNGDFDTPMFVHDTVPPGVPEMKKLRGGIH